MEIPCVYNFDGPSKHVNLLQQLIDLGNNPAVRQKLMLIVASKGDQRERKIQAMMAAKEKISELFACKQEPFPKNLG